MKFLFKAPVLNSTLQAVNDEQKLTSEVEKQYDVLVTEVTDQVKIESKEVDKKLTKELFPCGEAHEAFAMVTGVTCNSGGVVPILQSFAYIFAVNILFVALLYLTIFTMAFYQASKISSLYHQVACSNYHFVVDEDRTFDMLFG